MSLIETKMEINDKEHFTFDDLYRQFKKTRRGLNPLAHQRGPENPLHNGRSVGKVFPLVVLAMAYPQSLHDSFRNVPGVNIAQWTRRYS